MSYNILQDDPGRPKGYSWQERKSEVISLIRSQKIDVLCAQEDYLNQGEDICRATGFYKIGVSRNEGKTNGKGEFVAIYYKKERFRQEAWGRFWMSETPDVPSKSWDAAVLRICNWAKLYDRHTGRKFYVFNTHLDHHGSVARLEAAKLIRKKIQEIAGNNPFILAGDMNTAPQNPPVKVFTDFMKDSREVSLQSPSGPVGTFNGMDWNRELNWRIDYIFTSEHFQVLEYHTLDNSKDEIYPSDHLPVLTKLELSKN